jgi:hypothetical protein
MNPLKQLNRGELNHLRVQIANNDKAEFNQVQNLLKREKDFKGLQCRKRAKPHKS